jgi:hypothetical protein
MRLTDLKPGDVVIADASIACVACVAPGPKWVAADPEGSLFIPCRQGRHYLDGQQGQHGRLIGLRFADAAS